jgi:hypothetical protein
VSGRTKFTRVLGVCPEIQGRSQSSSGKDSVDRAYLRLSASVLSGFCFVNCHMISARTLIVIVGQICCILHGWHVVVDRISIIWLGSANLHRELHHWRVSISGRHCAYS